jgi:general secretion pathway protein C
VEDAFRLRAAAPVMPLAPGALVLVGTLVAERPQGSLAALGGAERVRLVGPGERIGGAEVVSIDAGRVVLRAGDELMELVLGGLPQPTPLAAAHEEIHCAGERCEIDAGEVQAALADLPALGHQARIVPAFREGRAEGFRIHEIRPGSLYQRLGLQNRDVIRRIDGTELTSMDAVLGLYQRARSAERLEVEIERAGVSVRRTIEVRASPGALR